MPAPQRPTARSLREGIRDFALNLGFDACGFASPDAPIDPDDHFRKWLADGYQGKMDWLAETAAIRLDVHRKLPGIKTVVVLARNYYAPRPDAPHPSVGAPAR